MKRRVVQGVVAALVAAGAAVGASAEVGESCRGMNLRVKGWLGKRLDRMIERHVGGTDVDYITAPFFAHNERNGRWRTEFWGKFMHSAEPFAAYRELVRPGGAECLRPLIDEGVRRILAAQEPSGYIGNYPDELRFGAGWDIWGMKYTMMGLLHNYDGTGNRQALEACRRLCDHVIAEIGPNGRRGRPLAKTGFCAGMPSLSILEPVMWLYNRTKERRYLDFAAHIVRQMDDPEVGPQLITLRDCPVWRRNDPSKDAVTWIGNWNRLKAYEMMSCYQGLIEYYLVEREEKGPREEVEVLLKAAISTAESIVKDELNLAGGSCSGEHWFHGAPKQHQPYVHLQETCVTITWMRLLEKLSAVTGEARWADLFERTFFNAYLGALARDCGEFAGYTPLNGNRYHGQHHCEMHTDCCNANGPRGFLSFLRAAVRVKPGEVIVDQYASGVVEAKLPDGRIAGFDMYTLYPQDGLATLNARTAGRFKLTVRVPAWSTGAEVWVNEECAAKGRTGYVTMDRDWRPGDKVSVCLKLPVVAHVNDGHVAFTRGPVLLARDTRLDDLDLSEAIRPDGIEDGKVMAGGHLVRRPSDDFILAFELPLPLGTHHENPEGRRETLVRFCDYASAGNEWRPENSYRTWFPLERHPWD